MGPLRTILVLAVLSVAATVQAEQPEATAVDFERDVREVLMSRCVDCHGAQENSADLRLDAKPFVMAGGESGVILVPGDSAASLLFQRITSDDEAQRMPPEGEPLTPQQIDRIRAWIDAGADWPENDQDRAAAVDPRLQHWAFQPLRSPAALPYDSIDQYLLERLESAGLTFSPPADRQTLIRRLYLNVIGLPPAPEQVADFLADTDPLAYEKLVDRLLASPRFGERWARHWLDVVRFAESDGFEMNLARPNAWPYRDYVIRAFNEDMPYDRFVREQLAGDTLGADAATGFLVGGAYDRVKSPDPALTANQRANELHDMASTTAATFLGLTLNCARCHDHKFDPIPTEDYYALVAMLQGVQHGQRPLADRESTSRENRRREIARELATIEAQLAPHLREPVVHGANEERFAAIEARYLRFTVNECSTAEPCVDELEVFSAEAEPRNVALSASGARATASGTFANGEHPKHRLEHVHDGRYGNDFSWISSEPGRGWVQLEFARPERIDRVLWSRDRGDASLGTVYEDRLATGYHVDVSLDGDTWTTVASSHDRLPREHRGSIAQPPALEGVPAQRPALVQQLLKQRAALRDEQKRLAEVPLVYAGTFEQPGATHRLHRGDPLQPRDLVAPGTLSQIGEQRVLAADSPDTLRRRALGEWITAADNPLTARVIVNRLWHYHFGTGIVDTPSDFGLNGSRPTHPELLDFLSHELISHGWSLKHVHRLILLSQAYRQSSGISEAAFQVDSGARLLWRFPPRRLEAEVLRDSMLSVSGQLNLTMGGPGFDLFEPNSNYVKVYVDKTEFGPDEFRRMVYQSKPRMVLDAFFGAFDCPDAGQPAATRTSSTTPLQALNLLNGSFAIQQAEFFAARLEREAGADVVEQIKRAYGLAFAREPSVEEIEESRQLVAHHGLFIFCRALLNANELLHVN